MFWTSYVDLGLGGQLSSEANVGDNRAMVDLAETHLHKLVFWSLGDKTTRAGSVNPKN